MAGETVTRIVGELIPLIRSFAQGEYAIALGGAHAKGTADGESDLDLYLFANSVVAADERTRMVQAFSPDVESAYSWEAHGETGTDFCFRGLRVECWLRNAERIERTIADCQRGIVRREFVTWTTTGFYNHCALSDIKAMVPLEDPSGVIARWKAQVLVYPSKLRQAIVQQHLPAAKFWPENFHYLSAIERADLIYTSGIVQQVVHNLIQVLFALNQTYFPGDKRLAEALERLPLRPPRLTERIAALLHPPSPASRQVLRQQREVLVALVDEVSAMCVGDTSTQMEP